MLDSSHSHVTWPPQDDNATATSAPRCREIVATHVAAMKAQLTSALPMRCPCVVSIEHCPSETWRNVEKHGLSGRIAMPSGQVAKWPSSVNRRIDEWVVTLVLWGSHGSAMTQVLEKRNATGPSGGPGSLLLFTESVYMCLLSFNLSFTHLSTFLCMWTKIQSKWETC